MGKIINSDKWYRCVNPICMMPVEYENAIHESDYDKGEYYCSENCRSMEHPKRKTRSKSRERIQMWK